MVEPAPAPARMNEPRNTDPKTIMVGALASAQNSILPVAAIMFSTGGFGLLVAIPAALAIIAIGTAFSYLAWKRLTYTIGRQDIRVESGILSRAARSVPYERIQDVSLEQKLIPRLFGLVAVKFETGAGGGEDLSLSYLTEERGEELRQLVREWRDEQSAEASADPGESVPAKAVKEQAEPLFTMGTGRLFTFGLFEFSLAVFAVLGGLLQYADTLFDFEFWDPDIWRGWIDQTGIDLSALDATMQILGAIAGIVVLLIIGSLTGMIRVFTREWDFLLERTARGFRRRRGLFTKTDVVMPIHRVQGVKLNTGFVRYRFGWHGLSFVSLAQDMGASSHVVAPFAKLGEIAPIVEAAGFKLPGEDADWRRASGKYLVDNTIIESISFVIGAVVAGIATAIYAPEWVEVAVGIPLVLAGLTVVANALAWRFQRHALGEAQIMSTRGVLAPKSQIATRLKLHSVEISQGPIARLRGYATIYLGQAGGTFSIRGVPIERARELRGMVLETIAATDFSQLESQTA
ncbi:YdbT [Erythrobacter sp. NAP1]|uniref:PH domain-containing protein n=1 Tax=Erythrobacter sp. NAP1 TaxID=237727 RepID=UPI0000687989|nr:PH domain-containing protein [Erythrobacter sp. NAP1]EAQ28416.1 YdbT [Erythrobacter sp. NAP1]